MLLRLDHAITHRKYASSVMALSGHLDRICSISEAVKARIVCVRMLPSMSAASNTVAAVSSSGRFEDAHLVVLTESPIHLFDSHAHRLHLGSPSGYALGRLFSALDALIGELHQTDIRRLNLVHPSGNP